MGCAAVPRRLQAYPRCSSVFDRIRLASTATQRATPRAQAIEIEPHEKLRHGDQTKLELAGIRFDLVPFYYPFL